MKSKNSLIICIVSVLILFVLSTLSGCSSESVPEPVEKKEKLQPILDENDLLDSKIPVEHISNDTPEKRKLNSDVLIKNINSENKLDSEKELKEEKANERMQKNNQNEGILTLAQQMQKEREGENNVKK